MKIPKDQILCVTGVENDRITYVVTRDYLGQQFTLWVPTEDIQHSWEHSVLDFEYTKKETSKSPLKFKSDIAKNINIENNKKQQKG